jgi:hypothetical protein
MDLVLAAVTVPEVNADPVLSGHEKDSIEAG